MDKITKESQYVLTTLYKEYLDKINNGISKSKAKENERSKSVYDKLFSDMLWEDFLDSCRELSKQNLLNVRYANNIPKFISITNRAIVEMENKFSKNVTKILDTIIKIKRLLL